MGLRFIKDGGVIRRSWYAQYKDGGRVRAIKLNTPMRGTIPASIHERGDEAFERSRAAALQEFARFEHERSVKGGAEHLTAALIESKTGQAVEYVKLAELESAWRRVHPRQRSEGHDKALAWFFKLFVGSVRRRYVYEVTAADVSRFYADIRQRFAWSTTKRIMYLLKGAFADTLPAGAANPFAKVELIGGRDSAAVHRRPLSNDELARVIDEARRTDGTLHALAVTAASTGMRIGDVCNLRWASVDLRQGTIEVTTRKTGADVCIPILAPLRSVLECALAEADDGEEYVFPVARRLYTDNYTGLIQRGKKLFAHALFADEAKREAAVTEVNEQGGHKTGADVLAAIRSAEWTAGKAAKVERAYLLYAAGSTYRQIERETGFSRGQISMYLHEAEDVAGVSFVRWAKRNAVSSASLLRRTQQKRVVGCHAASLYGWHSFRASFVVAALNAGVPLEVVRRIVGHATADMTLEYFNPTKRIMADVVRRRLAGSAIGGGADAVEMAVRPSLPSVPADGAGDSSADCGRLAALLSGMTAAEREQLKALLG